MSLVLPDWYYSCPDFVDWSDPINWDCPLNKGLMLWDLAVPDILGFGSNDLWRDATHRYPGTLTGFTAGGSHWGGALGRPGGFGALTHASASSQYVSIGSSTGLQLNAFTVEGWVYATAGNNKVPWSYTTASPAKYGWNLIVNASGQLRWEIETTGFSTLTDTVDIRNKWTFVTATYDGATSSLYRNGILATSGAKTGNISYGTSPSLRIGSRAADSLYYDGSVDSVAYFDYPMSASEVHARYVEECLGCPNALNRIPFDALVQQAAAPGGTTSPWYYYMQQQMLTAG